MPGMLPLLLLAGAAAFALGSSKKSGGAGGGGGVTPLPTNPDSKYDANLPAILEATVDQELLNDGNPDSLRRFADALEAQGYPIAAAALRARAAELDQPVPPPPPPIQPAPPPPVVPPPPPPDPGNVVVVTPPIVITPSTGQDFGVDATQWDPSWGTPAANYPTGLVPYKGGFTGSTARAKAIQQSLNLWAMATQFDPDAMSGYYPIDVDGAYGTHTASLAAAFQRWVNATNAADYASLGMTLGAQLAEDGVIGPLSVKWLQPWAQAAQTTIPS